MSQEPKDKAKADASEEDSTSKQDPEVARLRSMRLSEAPPTSSASLLSLANAFAASDTTPPPSSRRRDAKDRPSSGKLIAAQPVNDGEGVLREMRDKFSLGDYTGALAIAESLAENPAHAEEARRCAEACRTVLEKMYAARIGPLHRVPHVIVPREQLRWLSIDHRAGFVLSNIDGVSSLEMILDVSGMPTLDVLRILHRLLQEKVIAIR